MKVVVVKVMVAMVLVFNGILVDCDSVGDSVFVGVVILWWC